MIDNEKLNRIKDNQDFICNYDDKYNLLSELSKLINGDLDYSYFRIRVLLHTLTICIDDENYKLIDSLNLDENITNYVNQVIRANELKKILTKKDDIVKTRKKI